MRNKKTNLDELIDISKVSKNGKTFKTVSLFSGCGGLDLGFIGGFKAFNEENQKSFSENSFKVIWANDIDKMAVESYKKNIGNHIVCGDISDIPNSEIPDCDIVLGGFPCQNEPESMNYSGNTSQDRQKYIEPKM